AHFCVFSRREHLAAAIPPLQTRLCLRLPAYSASAKVICFIGKLGQRDRRITGMSVSRKEREPAVMDCKPTAWIASSLAINVSPPPPSVTDNLSPKSR
ncbi:hypothetical protein V2A47_33550, partial [Pseudomonas aeruginosa]